MVLKVFTDGGSKGNPGPSSIGMVFYEGDKKIFSYKESIGVATNNDAEYVALIRALEKLIEAKKGGLGEVAGAVGGVEKIMFFSDSRLMVNQVNGLFKIKNGKIREYVLKIRGLEQELGIAVSYSLIPREKNVEADKMVNSV